MTRLHLLTLTALVLAGCQPAAVKRELPVLPLPAAVKSVRVIGDITAAEGPAIDKDGNIYFVNYQRRGTIGRITPDGAASILVDLAKALPTDGRRTAAANGIKIDDGGNLIVAESGTGHVLRISPDGKNVQTLVSEFDGEGLQSVNDVALDRTGAIYFSCPPLLMTGRLRPSNGRVMSMNPEPLFSNGVAVSPDGKWLVIGDSMARRVVLFELYEGMGRRPRTLIDFLPPGYPREPSKEQQAELTAKKVAIPDGLTFDEFGRLWVATWDAGVVHVLEVPSGKKLATYEVGAGKVSNLHFYNGDLYVTADHGLYKLPVGVRGWRYSRGCGN